MLIGSDNIWISLAAGGHHSAAIKSDGTVLNWGDNVNGQLGDGTVTDRLSPIQPGATNIDSGSVSISAGVYHTLSIQSDGTLWAWGWNIFGQLGDGVGGDSYSPIQIGTDTDWILVATGVGHSVALKAGGTLWAWGYNIYGQLGDGTTVDKHSPVQIEETDKIGRAQV